MPPSPEILKTAIFGMGRKIGVPGAGYFPLFLIIAATGILILEQDGNGCTGGMTVEDPASENGQVIFFAGRGSFLNTSFAAFNIFQEIGYVQGQASRTAIQYQPYRFAMRFAKNMYAEYATETVHGLLVYWFIGLLVYWFIGLLVYSFIGLFVCWFIRLLVYWSTYLRWRRVVAGAHKKQDRIY
jgi:hypothetical protein